MLDKLMEMEPRGISVSVVTVYMFDSHNRKGFLLPLPERN
jgi:hypothetical protein